MTFLFLLTCPLMAQLSAKPLVDGVGVNEQLGENIDLSLAFTNTDGSVITLQDIFDKDLPTVLVPVYYTCPSLCTAILTGVSDLINKSDLLLGVQYQVVNVCFDPENTPEIAAAKAANYYQTLVKPEPAAENWYFLTGNQENITTLMDQIGFTYKKANDQYSHTSVLALISPKGKISRYLYGVNFDAKDFRLGMVETAQGKVGTTLDKILVYCFRFDPLAGKYVPHAWRLMRIGAALTLLFIAALLYFLWKKELDKRRLGQNV